MTTVFIDVETAGLDIDKSPIIQIAAVATRGAEVIAEFERKLLFDVGAADDGALELNSFSPEVWERDAIKPVMARAQLTAFLKAHATVEMVSQRTGNPYNVAQLAGHNIASFDAPMLQGWYRRSNEFFPASYKTLDTLQLAMWFCRITGENPINMKLATLAQHFGCEDGCAHDALSDAKTAHRLAVLMESRMRSEAQ